MNKLDDFLSARKKMVTDQLIARGIRDQRVLSVMQNVPRHCFVKKKFVDEAYKDYPLPIDHDQTISQPYIVALMTEALALKGDESVLEIGTGSGYQTAILAELSKKVYTIERIKPLLDKAREILTKMKYKNILFKAFDGTLGWEENGLYDVILVTAGAPGIPGPLIDQLAEGGRIVIPVGTRHSQELTRLTKKGGGILQKSLGGCRFVDLIGVHAWNGKV
jgi:protein-L-isoaspartate(D-aspartate) O-methyltransferase